MILDERFDDYVPTRGIFANRSIVLDTKKCECTQTGHNPIFYDSDKRINGLSYEGVNSFISAFVFNLNLKFIVGVQVAHGLPLWAPPRDFPAGTPDISVHVIIFGGSQE